MNNVVFCNVAWMKNYCGVTEDDKAVNGGKYVAEHDGHCMEVNNFLVHNRKCFGYFMHYGENLDLKRVNDKLSNVDAVTGVTVVWVATKPKDGGRYIVGWYENAKMFRKWQRYVDINLGQTIEQCYNFEADAKDCHLIPEDLRDFEVPSAPKNGKGKGMGQSNIWYADGDWARNTFVPDVLNYLETAKAACQKLANDFSHDELYTAASDKLETVEDVYDVLDELEKEDWYHSDWKRILGLYNLAVKIDSAADTYFERGKCFEKLFYIDEAIQDYQKVLEFDEFDFGAKFNLMDCYMALQNYSASINLGEQLVKQYNDTEDITDGEIFDVYDILTILYNETKEYEKALSCIAKMKNVRYIDYKDLVRAREQIILECMNAEA